MPSPFGNFFISLILNSPLYPLLGERFALITVTGRRSGKLYSTPINLIEVDGQWIATSLRKRTWWRNLGEGRTARLRRLGKIYQVMGDLVTQPDDVIKGLASFLHLYPGDARFFDVPLGPDGTPDETALARSADGRVLIRFRTV